MNMPVRRVAMALLVLATFYMYSLGFSAGFQFDDLTNISPARQVHDLQSALEYIFLGNSGPLGRPLSLLTFLLQKDSWPAHPEHFLLVNAIIHLFNGVLVYFFVSRFLHLFSADLPHPQWLSISISALWLALPLHVSASLMAVQRMTTLSAMFMLLGLIGYLAGREMLDRCPDRAYRLMTLSVVAGTVLAVLCKETGGLLPLYVLVTEFALLLSAGRRPAHPFFRRWLWLMLGVPLGAIVLYFAIRLPHFLGTYSFRAFGLQERLLTESRILWDYLGQVLIPARSGTGPFQDDYPISSGLFSPSVTAVAIAAWALTAVLAYRLRHRWPVLFFAVFWFLGGHVLESSILPLELYFEHRNYLPALGPIMLVGILVWRVPARIWRLSVAALALMIMLNMSILGETAQTWGKPLLAAHLWAEEHPQSVRAVQFLSVQLKDAGREREAIQAVMDGAARIPDDIWLALRSVQLGCLLSEDSAMFSTRLQHAQQLMLRGSGGVNSSYLLENMLRMQQAGKCPRLTLPDMLTLADGLLMNRQNQPDTGLLANLHIFRARVLGVQGKTDLAIGELSAAFAIKQELLVISLMIDTLVKAGRYDEADSFLDKAAAVTPDNPLIRSRWTTALAELKMTISQQRAHAPTGK